MPCEDYKDALIELASAPAEPEGDVREHLDACATCRSAFDEERTLFATINSGIRQMANAEVPASLLPGLHARLAQETSATKRAGTSSWMYATAAAAAALLLVLLPLLHPRNAAVERVAQQEVRQPLLEQKTAQKQAPSAPAVANRAIPRNRKSQSRNLAGQRTNPQPEVLVPPEEREAFAKFASRVVERRELAAALVNPAPETKAEPLNVELLQIARLEVKPLEEERVQPDTER